MQTHPFEVQRTMSQFGKAYAFWELKSLYKLSTSQALYLLFIASTVK
jgi:hypothetical protein